MRRTPDPLAFLRRGMLLLAVLVALCTVSCRPELVVRISTRVYVEGALDRVVEIRGFTAEGERPTDPDWLASEAGIRLAEPEAWGRVDQDAGRLRAEGYFPRVDDIPAILVYDTQTGQRPDRVRTGLQIDDRVVLRRWIYSETHGDPFSATESAAALEALVELAVEALREELHRHFGADLDTAQAEALLRNDGRGLASALLSVNRRTPGVERAEQRAGLWSEVLRQQGIEPVPVEEPLEYWDTQIPVMLEWSRARIAASISTPDAPVRSEELTFFPISIDDAELLTGVVERVWGGEEELTRLAEPHLSVLSGYYGGDNSPRFRFEVRVAMPGMLLRTNGTPDGDGALWLLREADLSFLDNTLRAESVELIDEPLVALGARRELDRARVVQLADLLWKRDEGGVLVDLLAQAVEQGRLDLLRDENRVPSEFGNRARELADLLDPEIPAPAPL